MKAIKWHKCQGRTSTNVLVFVKNNKHILKILEITINQHKNFVNLKAKFLYFLNIKKEATIHPNKINISTICVGQYSPLPFGNELSAINQS